MSINSTNYEVAILAGGYGTRLKERTGVMPKPMAKILGKPVLEHQINLCKQHGFKKIALLVHFEHETIRNYFGNGEKFGVEIIYCVEQLARGTAGALCDALSFMAEHFLVLYADTYADVDLRKFYESYTSDVSDAMIFLHPNDHPEDSDLIEIDSQARVVGVHPYPHEPTVKHANLVNAALYIFRREALRHLIPATGKSDLAKNIFPLMLQVGMFIKAYISPEYIKDMGTPERLDKVENDILMGLPDQLSNRHLRPAVFLDRDGTLNVEVDHLRSLEQLQLLPGVGEAIKLINSKGILAVGITNQPVIARGELSWAELNSIHAKLDNLLGQSKAYLDRMYVCPHHPNSGFSGEVAELKIDCGCRKPRAGLIDRAVAELNIDRQKSWMIGDRTSDIKAGKLAGLKTILVRTGYAGLDGNYDTEPDYVMPNLLAAVSWVIREHSLLAHKLFPIAVNAANERLVLIGGRARTGKTSAARVIVEQLKAAGRVAHIISFDGWLKPINERFEGFGVLNRYDIVGALDSLMPILKSKNRQSFKLPKYDRKNRKSYVGATLSIGSEDVIIVEGVPALMIPELIALSSVRLFLDADEEILRSRLLSDYEWRGEEMSAVEKRLSSRAEDELPSVLKSADLATHYFFTNLQK